MFTAIWNLLNTLFLKLTFYILFIFNLNILLFVYKYNNFRKHKIYTEVYFTKYKHPP